MALLKSIAGWTAFGLAARFLQLGIQQRPLWAKPGGHILSMTFFGTFGYFAHFHQLRVEELIKEKHSVLARNRQRMESAGLHASAEES